LRKNSAVLPTQQIPGSLPGKMVHDPIEIRHLRYVLAVAEAGSFSRAADRLGVSQPNISQQLLDLEAGLRVSLFQRRGKRILPTSAGLIFQGHARVISRQIESLLQDLSAEPGQMRGALHLGVVPILNVAFVPQLLGEFSSSHPGVSLNVEEISSTEIETALEEGRMDLGLGFLTRHSPNLHYERLCTDQFTLIVHESHKWAGRRMIDVSELHQERFLQLTDTFVMRRMSDAICREHQVQPRNVAELNSIETLLRSLALMQAAALMPKIALRGTTGLNSVRLKGKNLALEIGLLRLVGSDASDAVSEFAKLAHAVVPKIIRDQRSSARYAR
jgi:LysR family transcriptional regulator, cyn operon transcriptional activator